MPEQTFREQAIGKLLYERQSIDQVRAMLEQTDTNTRLNQEIARVSIILDDVTSHWKGNWKNLMGDFTTCLERAYLGLEAFGRQQAIEIAQATNLVGQGPAEPKKRGGIIGWLTGK